MRGPTPEAADMRRKRTPSRSINRFRPQDSQLTRQWTSDPRDKFGLVLVSPQPTTTIGEHAMRVFCAVSYILEQPSR